MIIEGITVSKPSSIMIEIVLSDEVFEVSLLSDILISQREEQAKITQTVFEQYVNLGKGKKIEDKGADMMT